MTAVMRAAGLQGSRLRKLAWKAFYGFVAWWFRTREWLFMNYGYHDEADPMTLQPGDEGNRYFIQLYAHTLGQAGPVAGRDVLEVGCGRGGGSEWIARTQGVRSMTGVDLARSAIALCKAWHRLPNLAFTQGDAERLPFSDASFDVVLNVESCHHYPSLATFFREVDRVLRPGGCFCIATYWPQSEVERVRRVLDDSPLDVVHCADITRHVRSALRASNDMKLALIKRHVPWFLMTLMRYFSAVEGTGVHRGFMDERTTYMVALLRKGDDGCGPEPSAAGGSDM